MHGEYAFGGPLAKLGFAGLAIAWLFTGARAFVAARTRDFVSHRRWMIRNFALTFAAVTLRLYLPPVFIVGLPFAMSAERVTSSGVALLGAQLTRSRVAREDDA